MAEEDEQDSVTGPPSAESSAESSAETLMRIPGLDLVHEQSDKKSSINRPVQSPFHNRPILEPTSGRRTLGSKNADAVSNNMTTQESADVFTTGQGGGSAERQRNDNIFALSELREKRRAAQLADATQKQIDMRVPGKENRIPPETPTKHRAISNAPSTPTSLVKALKSEIYDPDSPILPTPTLSSANLFSRRLHARRFARPSAGGPNGPRAQALAPDTDTESSPTSRAGSPAMLAATKATSTTLPNDPSGQDLRKSAMMLRRMNSEMREQRSFGDSYRSYRNFGDGDTALSSPSLADVSGTATPTGAELPEGMKNITAMENFRMQMKSPSTADMSYFLGAEDRRGTYLRPGDVPGPLNINRSRRDMHRVGVSPSNFSMGGQSDMWEDASVRSEDDHPGKAVSPPPPKYQEKQVVVESGFESFAGACEVVETRPVTKTPTKTPAQAARQRQPVVLDSGYESFAGACEVIDIRPDTKPSANTTTQKVRDKENIVLDSGFESFAGACEVVDPRPSTRTPTKTSRDRKRQGGLMISPQSTGKPREYGLGLMNMGPSAYGTPASLYDKDGFLKE